MRSLLGSPETLGWWCVSPHRQKRRSRHLKREAQVGLLLTDIRGRGYHGFILEDGLLTSQLERAMGIEPTALCLGSRESTVA